jgi:hypothetical protein
LLSRWSIWFFFQISIAWNTIRLKCVWHTTFRADSWWSVLRYSRPVYVFDIHGINIEATIKNMVYSKKRCQTFILIERPINSSGSGENRPFQKKKRTVESITIENGFSNPWLQKAIFQFANWKKPGKG